MHSIAFSKCIFPGIFVAVFCSPSSNFNLKEKHQLSTQYFPLNLIFTYQVDFHFICSTSLRCSHNSLNDTFGLLSLNSLFFLSSLFRQLPITYILKLHCTYLVKKTLRLFTSISLVWDALIILRMIPLGTLLSLIFLLFSNFSIFTVFFPTRLKNMYLGTSINDVRF